MQDQQLPKPSKPTEVTIKPGDNGSVAVPPPPPKPPTPPAKPVAAPVAQPIPAAQPVADSDTTPPPSAMKKAPTPPSAVTALSSMASNQLPTGAAAAPTPQQRPAIQDNPNLRAAAPIPQAAPQMQQAQQQQSAPPAQPQPAKPPAAPEKPATNQPKLATTPKKSVLKYLPFVAIGALVLIVIGVIASRFLGGGSTSVSVDGPSGTGGSQSGRTTVTGEPVTIEYWGLWEPSQVFEQVIADFESENPGVSVQYSKQSHQDYRERLQTAIASGNGPDVFRFHATWTPMMRNDLQPLPSSVITANDLQSKYYPVASQQLQLNGQPIGVPIMYDGLALLYNKDIFDTAGVQPPQTWSELRTTASKLTVRSGNTIQRAGVALGTATNVDHFSDILALLLLQNGADPSKPNSAFTRDAITFYTNFTKADKVWSETLPNSTVAFARGEVAMIFAPSWRLHEIQAMNPDLDLGVVPVPKLSDERLAWASYWAEGVSARSNKKEAAQAFVAYISQPEVLEKLFSAASQVRGFGEMYPRVDMADKLANNELVSAYLQDAPYAQGWYLSSATHDNGINDQLIKYYEDAVTAVLGGEESEDVLSTIELGTTQVLRQYGVAVGTGTTGR